MRHINTLRVQNSNLLNVAEFRCNIIFCNRFKHFHGLDVYVCALEGVCTGRCVHWKVCALEGVCTGRCVHWKVCALEDVCTDVMFK